MYRSIRLTALLLLSSVAVLAQRPVELPDLYESRVFNAKGVQGFRSLEDGIHFSRRTAKGIERFSFATGESAGILVASIALNVVSIPSPIIILSSALARRTAPPEHGPNIILFGSMGALPIPSLARNVR